MHGWYGHSNPTPTSCHVHACGWLEMSPNLEHQLSRNCNWPTTATTTLPGTPSVPTTTTLPGTPSVPTTTTTLATTVTLPGCRGTDPDRHYHLSTRGEWTCHQHYIPAVPLCNTRYQQVSGGGHTEVYVPCPAITSIIASPSIVDGTVAQTSVTFTVNLESAAPSPMTVLVSFSCCGVPYFIGADLWTRTLSFTTGETSSSMTLTSRGRALGSSESVLRLRATASPPLINLVGQIVPSLGGAQHTVVTITPPVPSVQLTYNSLYYGYYTTIDEGWRAGFRVSLSRVPESLLTVRYEITDGFNFLVPGTSTFGSIEITGRTASILIDTDDDMVDEPHGLLVVRLLDDPHYTLGLTSASVTVIDDDGTPQVSISGPAASVDEGDPLVYTVTLSNEQHWTPATFDWETTNAGSATAGVDYRSDAGTVTFAARRAAVWNPWTWSWTPAVPGETTKTIEVDTLTDLNSPEPDETVVIELSDPIDATLDPANSSASGVIRDVPPPPKVSLPSTVSPVAETSTAGVQITAVLDRPTPAAASVSVSASGAARGYGSCYAGVEFYLSASTFSFGVGADRASITLYPCADVDSDDETVTLTLTTVGIAGLRVGTPASVDVTIRDRPVVSVTGPVTVDESAGAATLTVRLSKVWNLPVDVDVDTADGTATAPDDYTTVNRTVTIPAGSTSVDVSVTVIDDNDDEPAETFTVTLSNATNASGIATTTATTTIRDNDKTAVRLKRTGRAPVVEGDTTTFLVKAGQNRGLGAGESVTVELLTSLTGTATRGVDYTMTCPSPTPVGVTCNNLNTATTPTVTFTGGSTPAAREVEVTLTAVDDGVWESGSETVDIGLSVTSVGLDGGVVTRDYFNVFNITDPPTVWFETDIYTVQEGDIATLTVNINPTRTAPTTVTFTTTDVTTNSGDYTPGPYTATILAGQSTATFDIPTLTDGTDETDETFTVTIDTTTAGVLTRSPTTATVTITPPPLPAIGF